MKESFETKINNFFSFFVKTQIGQSIVKWTPASVFYGFALLKNKLAFVPSKNGKKSRLSSKEKIFTLAEARKLIDNFDVISLDIFDTLIARQIPSEALVLQTGSFAQLLLASIDPQITASIFNKKRAQITQRHYQNNLSKGLDAECKINDIFVDILYELKVPSQYIEHYATLLLENEIKRECQTLYVIDGVEKFLEYCKSKNKKIIAISDMYFSKNTMQQILKHLGLLHYFSFIYVSSEYKLLKSTGELFDHVIDDLKIDRQRIIHIGDNFSSDVIAARRRGIFSIWYTQPKVVARQWNTDFYYKRYKNFTKFVHGKIKQHLLPKKIKTFENFVNYYLSLDICNFVFDMLCKAPVYGIKTIYFLEKDATLFYQLAKIFQEKMIFFQDIPRIALRRIKLSRRQSAPLVDYHSSHAVIKRASHVVHFDDFSILKVLGAFGISEDQLDPVFLAEVVKNDSDQCFFFHSYERKIKPLIQKKQMETVNYLNEFNFFSGEKLALCDIGWAGTIQKDIAGYINRHYLSVQCCGFYYGTSNQTFELDAYYPGARYISGYMDANRIKGAFSAVEFFVSDHSALSANMLNEFTQETVFLNTRSREAILNFSHQYVDFVHRYMIMPWDIVPISQRLVIKFFTAPPKRFIRKVNKVRFSLDRKDDDCGIQLIPCIRVWRLYSDLLKAYRSSQWYQAGIKNNFILNLLNTFFK